MGRLYKRDSEGREYKASAKVHGVFWLEYRVAGKRIREPLTDENDEPITDREKAENARLKKVAPFLAANEREALERIHARVVSARQAQDKAEDEAATPVALADVWQTYLAAPGRPDSGPETLIQYHYQFNRFARWIKNCERFHVMGNMSCRDSPRFISWEAVRELQGKSKSIFRIAVLRYTQKAQVKVPASGPWWKSAFTVCGILTFHYTRNGARRQRSSRRMSDIVIPP